MFLQSLQTKCSLLLLLSSACFLVSVWSPVHLVYFSQRSACLESLPTQHKCTRQNHWKEVGYLQQLNKDLQWRHSSEIQSQKQAHSTLSGTGSRHHNENGVTRDSGAELGIGQLTGRGNRRPEVICDVISRRRKSTSIGSTQGIPVEFWPAY